jgi:hypothetical protein
MTGLASAVGSIGSILAAVGGAVGVVLSPIGLLTTGLITAGGAWLYYSGVGASQADFVTPLRALVFLKVGQSWLG